MPAHRRTRVASARRGKRLLLPASEQRRSDTTGVSSAHRADIYMSGRGDQDILPDVDCLTRADEHCVMVLPRFD